MGDLLDQLDKTTPVQRLLLLVLLLLGIGVGYFMIYYSATQEELTQAESQQRDLSDRRASLASQAQDIDAIRRDIQELCARRAAFLEKLPPTEEIPSLLTAVNQQAQLTGLTISTFTRGTNVPGPRYATIPVNIELKGTYDQVADFFYFVGRQQRIVNIADISMKLPAQGGGWRLTEGVARANELSWFLATDAEVGPPELTVKCQLRTYFANANAAGGGACDNS